MEAETQAARLLANLVGASRSEVVMMGALSSKLHLLLASFFQPVKPKGRTKILIEKGAFLSDWFVATSLLRWHGLDPTDSVLAVEPDTETLLLSDNTIVQTIEDNADSIALVLLSGVDFRTGQLLDIARIIKATRSMGSLLPERPAGFMVSSPSILDLSAATTSLQLFNDATTLALCEK
ncbi:hypothetical protein DV736_g1136, partial [Chaetothyriales sp. CBS 134916]